MADEISGQVTEGGTPVEDAVVAALRQEDAVDLSQAQATEIEALAKLTDANGEYIFEPEELYDDAQNYHVVAHKDAGDQRRGQQNYPYVEGVGSTIPDSVIYQHTAETFSTGDGTWADQVGLANMSMTGDPQSVALGGGDGVEGDGTDDTGSAPTQDLPTNETWGVAFTFSLASISSLSAFWGVSDGGAGSNRFTLFSGSTGTAGDIELDLRDANDINGMIRKRTDNTYDDATPRAVVINKSGNSATDVDFYVSDMTTPTATTTVDDSGFSHADYSQATELQYLARNPGSGASEFTPVTFGIIEFNSEPYTQSERESFVERRPEV